MNFEKEWLASAPKHELEIKITEINKALRERYPHPGGFALFGFLNRNPHVRVLNSNLGSHVIHTHTICMLSGTSLCWNSLGCEKINSKGQINVAGAAVMAIVGVLGILVFASIYAGLCKANISTGAQSLLDLTDLVLAAVLVIGIVSLLIFATNRK